LSRAVVAAAAVAPSRIDLAGGTLDIWPISEMVSGAVTVNLAIHLDAAARVAPRSDERVEIVSADRGRRMRVPLPIPARVFRGPLSWLARLIEGFAPGRALTLAVHAEAPAGAGLGGSSALGIAVGAALARATGEALSREALVRRVQNLETRQIRVPTGSQDYRAAVWGGLSAFAYGPDGIVREGLPHGVALASRLVLAYTGEPRQSGFSNWDMFRRYVEGESRTVRRMERIAQIAGAMRDAVRHGDLDEAGRLLGEEGRLRYALAPSVATVSLLAAGRAARRAGALGVKVCGAGGGGCLAAFARDGRTDDVARAIAATGARVLPVRYAPTGVAVSGRRPGR
jgi:D-glycero-alpha-D-manno-heptose-7-phosphate kinase